MPPADALKACPDRRGAARGSKEGIDTGVCREKNRGGVFEKLRWGERKVGAASLTLDLRLSKALS